MQIQLRYAITLGKSTTEVKEALNTIKINARELKPRETLSILSIISRISYDSTYDNEIKAMLMAMNRALYPNLQNKAWEKSLIKLKLVMKAYGLE